MRPLLICILATFTVMLLLAVTAQAGQREGAFTLSPMVGYHLFGEDQATEDDLAAGFAFGYNVSKRWSAELEFRYTSTETALKGAASEDLDVWSVGMNALFHFNPDGPFVPYLSAGFGGMFFLVDGYKDDEDYMMNWGVGAKYFINDNTALRLDLRHVVDFHSDRDWDRPSGYQHDNNFLATAGLYWQFGGSAATPPPPRDSDGDGIIDIRDKCPDTPWGLMVDAVGCAPVMKAPPPPPKPPAPAKIIAGDDDGDGVPNSRDKCPGTQKGAIVDDDGCAVKFTLQIEFDFDKSEVRPEYHQKLYKAAEFISKYPGTRFLIAGHTDSRGTEEYNQRLSIGRAAAVKKYLVEKFGLAAHMMNSRGYGESRPIDTNDTEEGRQRNRRVEVIEFIIIPPE